MARASGTSVFNLILPTAGSVALALGAGLCVGLSAGTGPAFAEGDFPLIGNYTQNVPCKGDGTDPVDVQVKISSQQIVSNVGVCTVLNSKQDGDSITAHVECKLAGGPLMGDITFTPRPDNTISFFDREGNYKAVLHRCPN